MREVAAAAIGFLAAALVPVLAFAVRTPLHAWTDFSSLLGFLVVWYFFSLLATLLFGVPAFLILRFFGLVRLWTTLVAGSFGGIAVGMLLRWQGRIELRDLLVTCAMGVVSAFVFWLIWSLCLKRSRLPRFRVGQRNAENATRGRER